MKRLLTTSLALLVIVAPYCVADCVADLSVADAQHALQQGSTLETQGKLWDAIKQYDTAQGYVCEQGGNPVARQALRKAMALGSKQGKLEQDKGNLFNDGKPAGAFQWYEKGAHYAAADQALIAALKQTPTNLQLSAFAQEHFKTRSQNYFLANNKMAIDATGGYTLDQAFDSYVSGLPASNIDRLLASYQSLLPDTYLQALVRLEQQKDALQPGDIAGAISAQQAATQFEQQWQTDRLEEVRTAFDEAFSWTQQVRDYKAADVLRAKIDQARLSHADRLSTSYAASVKLMESALQFYRQHNKDDKINALEKKARRYAEQAMAEKHYQRASAFYLLLNDYDNEQLARAALETQQQHLATEAQMGSAAQLAELQKMYSDPKNIQQLQQQALELQNKMEAQRKNADTGKYQQETDALAEDIGL
jgi:hypothetical protein